MHVHRPAKTTFGDKNHVLHATDQDVSALQIVSVIISIFTELQPCLPSLRMVRYHLCGEPQHLLLLGTSSAAPHYNVMVSGITMLKSLVRKCNQTLNFMPPFAQMTLPVVHPASGKQSIPTTPATSSLYAGRPPAPCDAS